MENQENEGNNKANEKIFLLTNIFHNFPNNPGQLLPLISSPNEIHVLFSFLNYKDENSTEQNNNIYNTIIKLFNGII